MRRRLQRRDRQGRDVLSIDRQEAPASAGDRASEPAALHLSGRFGRGQPAESDGRLSGSRSFRPHLLQPGDDVGGRHSAGRGRHGLVHGGRRLRSGDVGRVDHRARAGDDLPRRPAAREGGHRRDRHGRGAWRSGRAHAHLGRRRPFRQRRSPCARDRTSHRRPPQWPQAGDARRAAAGRTAAIRPRSCMASSTPTSASRTMCAK